MTTRLCRPGAILFYIRPASLLTDAIVLGERIEDGYSRYYPYHVAVALNDRRKIEALTHGVEEDPIVYSRYMLVVDPPVDPERQEYAVQRIRTLIHQQYDWLLVADDALRILSRGHVHFPNAFIERKQRREKICVSVVRLYLKWAGSPVRIPYWATPLDAYHAIEEYNRQHA